VLGSAATGGVTPVSPGRHGRHLLCANYTGGSRAVFALDDTGLIVARTDLVEHDGAGRTRNGKKPRTST
jgi:6-phosphogluconolactonase (cycloisomerase 2 family)